MGGYDEDGLNSGTGLMSRLANDNLSDRSRMSNAWPAEPELAHRLAIPPPMQQRSCFENYKMLCWDIY